MTCNILQGDCRRILRTLPEQSIQCVVTSPPYWGLRDYQVEGQFGLESTLDEYIANLVDTFREVRRVLRDDGTVWLNLGNSYHQKNLMGMPWRVAFALQADGWYLRSDIVWKKPNPMPESTRDRPTKSHEMLFLLTKSPKYYCDMEAIKEPSIDPESHRGMNIRNVLASVINDPIKHATKVGLAKREGQKYPTRNKRDVWTIPLTESDLWPMFQLIHQELSQQDTISDVWEIATQSYKEAHFATFPEKLVLPCILAGTSAKGCCPDCGNPWQRIVERRRKPTRPGKDNVIDPTGMAYRNPQRHETTIKHIGWKAGCNCNKLPVPCNVLDPFAGSGTVGVVCKERRRHFIGIELKEEYCGMAERRIAKADAQPPPPLQLPPPPTKFLPLPKPPDWMK